MPASHFYVLRPDSHRYRFPTRSSRLPAILTITTKSEPSFLDLHSSPRCKKETCGFADAWIAFYQTLDTMLFPSHAINAAMLVFFVINHQSPMQSFPPSFLPNNNQYPTKPAPLNPHSNPHTPTSPTSHPAPTAASPSNYSTRPCTPSPTPSTSSEPSRCPLARVHC